MSESIEQSVKENTSKILKQINNNMFNDLREQLLNPEFITNMDYRIQCAMCGLKPEHKTDCYFYEEIQDMAAHIPTCNYHGQLGYCKCKDCDKYISAKNVFQMVKEKVDNKNRE